jgi:flagellar motor switch protein FliN
VKQDEIAQSKGRPLLFIDSTIFKDVRVALQAKLGQATLTVADLLALRSGSILKLDAKISELVELRLNDSIVARGEIVAVDDNFGVRIVEVAEIS